MPRYLPALLSVLLAAAVAGCAEEPFEDPVPLEGDSPFRYPLTLWDEGAEGASLLMVHVTETGTVDSAYVDQTSGYPAFDSAAVAGAMQLRFLPARRGEERTDAWVRFPVRFQRPESAPQPQQP